MIVFRGIVIAGQSYNFSHELTFPVIAMKSTGSHKVL